MGEAATQIIELTERSFEDEVLSSEMPVLVDFWAPWCGPCRNLAPTIDRLATDFAGEIKVAKLDVDQAPKISEQFGVKSIPNVMIFKSGEKVSSMIGVQPHNAYATVLDSLLTGASEDEIADRRIEDPDARASFIQTASVKEVRDAFSRNPALATAPGKDGLTPLSFALRSGAGREKAEMLLSFDPVLSFHDFAGLGRLDELRAAIKADPEILNKPAPDGHSALSVAVMNDQADCVELLLCAGADPNPPTRSTPIQIAVSRGNLEITGLLLDHGADEKLKNLPITGTLLHLAAVLLNHDLAKFLMDRGFDITAKDDNDKTAYEAAKARLEEAHSKATPERAKKMKPQLETLKALEALLTQPQKNRH